ncbi:MAG: hypothetical protein IJ150_11675 [Bacteroidales bacterium]|nr:hypothetical protein [Bacteroidales bacterium]
MHSGFAYRIDEDFYTLLNNFDEIATPTFVVIGKDGEVKDSHTGFRSVEYYKQKIQEELKK